MNTEDTRPYEPLQEPDEQRDQDSEAGRHTISPRYEASIALKTNHSSGLHRHLKNNLSLTTRVINKDRPLQNDSTTRREPSRWAWKRSTFSCRPFLAPARAAASSADVSISLPTPEPPPVPEPLRPAPTSDDDVEFDDPVYPELFSCPPLPSIDSALQDTQDTQSEEIGNESSHQWKSR